MRIVWQFSAGRVTSLENSKRADSDMRFSPVTGKTTKGGSVPAPTPYAADIRC
jgi:hypothetical protein